MVLLARDRPALLRARLAVYGLFLLSGLTIGTWTARIPAIKERLALGDGELSLGLLGIAAGAITGMQIVGRLIDRFGSHRVMIPMAVAQGFVLVLPAYVPNLPALALALFVLGLAQGSLDVAMNANAVVVERAYGKTLMGSFHAVFSIGGFLGAAIGGLFAHASVDAGRTFLSAGLLILVLAVVSARWAMRDAPAEPPGAAAVPDGVADGVAAPGGVTAGQAAGARLPRGVLFLGVLAFCCLVGEGAAADWSAVYLVDSLGSSPGAGATAYAAFAVMMTVGRFAGDRLAGLLGPVPLVRCCGILAAGGLALAVLGGAQITGVIGFGLFGAGLSCTIPQVFSAAGHRDPAQAGRALARVASLGYAGFLAGPVLIGGASELTTLRHALLIPVILSLFVAFAAPALRAPQPADADAAPEAAEDAAGAGSAVQAASAASGESVMPS
ncbi:MFS transporter [Microtetraspora sp. NBRC 16547]|uniref:MFS transporter n=1 Tax=Microtetraspora sp. NBRC 16547 TaxID=3030993 RepID=UPI0024A17F71|nr:MFS transporter [Microtetraspora sp. NBRC 16547]GLW98656.1 MFS transporter [Microtetraspora sp. NBRC 16547]